MSGSSAVAVAVAARDEAGRSPPRLTGAQQVGEVVLTRKRTTHVTVQGLRDQWEKTAEEQTRVVLWIEKRERRDPGAGSSIILASRPTG